MDNSKYLKQKITYGDIVGASTSMLRVARL